MRAVMTASDSTARALCLDPEPYAAAVKIRSLDTRVRL
jgi:hypothetical protein